MGCCTTQTARKGARQFQRLKVAAWLFAELVCSTIVKVLRREESVLLRGFELAEVAR
jgi:hypothetical protein